MTVSNTAYCSIDEAWGDLSNKPRNKKKKSPQDPMCDLYDAKINSNYSDTDLVRFANEYYDSFDKSKYQRNMKTQSMAYETLEREPSPKNLTIKKNQNVYDITNSEQPQNRKKPNNSALFEKQFEMKLPPLYDNGDECIMPSEESRTPSFRGAHPQPISRDEYVKPIRDTQRRIVNDEEWRMSKNRDLKPNSNLYDSDYEGCMWDEEENRNFMGMAANMPTYSEVNGEQNLIRPSSVYKAPMQENNTFMEAFTSGKELYSESPDPVYTETRPRPSRRYSSPEEEHNQHTRHERYNSQEDRPHFFDDYDDAYGFKSYKKKTSNLQILDLILYIISGIILIFLLEQFVKIGINMQSSI